MVEAINFIQALMTPAQQVVQEAQSSEKGGFGQDPDGLDFMDHLFVSQDQEQAEEAGELAFAAMQMPQDYQQNIVFNFEEPLTSHQVPQMTFTSTEAASEDLGFQNLDPKLLLSQTENQNQKSLFIQGLKGEVKLVDESISPELGLALPNDATDTGPVQYVDPEGINTDLNPYQALTPEAKAAVDQDKTLTVIQNEEGQMELAPYQSSPNSDLDFGSGTPSDSNDTLDLSTPSSDSRAPDLQNQKGSSFVAELQIEGPTQVTEMNTGIHVETKSGDVKFEGTLRTQAPESSQVMDQIFTKMDFPSLKQKGEQKISIVLDPQELGRVDVELKIDGDKVNAVFKADQSALNFARSDADKLAQMLKEQGFQASTQDFQFQERASQESQYAEANFAYGSFALDGEETAPTLPLTKLNYNRSVSGRSYDAVI